MAIYLYEKTHRVTGLKYLGKTTTDPFNYEGSGIDWLAHIKKHENNVDTNIVKICHSKEELSYWGRYYSKLWNVVGAMDDFGNKIWANRIPETGGGSGRPGKPNPRKHGTPRPHLIEINKSKKGIPKSEKHKQNLRKPKKNKGNIGKATAGNVTAYDLLNNIMVRVSKPEFDTLKNIRYVGVNSKLRTKDNG